MKKKKAFPKKTALLLTAAAVLLAGSGIGSTRAALTYYSENYLTQISTQDIGVTLVENDEDISYRNYNGSDWDTATGELLAYTSKDGFEFAPGETYDEVLKVKNSGSIDSYVRVIITKSWQKPAGTSDSDGSTTYEKDPDMNLDWIELVFQTDDGWIINTEQSTAERTVLYYTKVVKPESYTNALTKSIRINEAIAADVTQVTNEDGSVSYEYEYDKYRFTLDAEVDAVQTHNAVDAIKSAWGVNATLDGDGNITSITAE